MAGFSWLHITDLHAGAQDQEWLWPTLRDEFYRDLEKVLDKASGCDLVLFTGDLTQKGLASDFDTLSRILDDVWQRFISLGLTPRLAAVSGNHDLLRPDKRHPVVKALANWHSDAEIRDEFWRNSASPYRETVAKCFDNYSRWSRDLALPKLETHPGLLPGDFSATFSFDQYTLGLIGLNTSFLQLTEENYEGRLDVGLAQLHAVCNGDAPRWCQSHDLNLLLTHHPSEWLHPSAQDRFRAEVNVPGRFFSHLCGHLHQAQTQWVSEAGASPRRLWQGPSLYGLRYYTADQESVERTHGYLVGRIDIGPSGARLRLWPRESRLSYAGHRRMAPDHGFELDVDEALSEHFALRQHHAASPPSAEEVPLHETSFITTAQVAPQLEAPSDQNLVDRPPDETAARTRLASVPRWRLRPAPAHLAIRLLEQQAVARALSTDRGVWLVADWGLGKEEFIGAALSREGHGEPLDVFRINCESLTSIDDLLPISQQQLGISLPELCANLTPLPSAYLIFDDVPGNLPGGYDFTRPLEESGRAMLDMVASLRIIFTSRRLPSRSRFSVTQLQPLDEPDCAKYIATHPDGGPNLLAPLQLERIYQKSEGIPMHLDRMLKELQTISIDELSEIEREGIPIVGEPVPRALVQSVAMLQASDDRYTRRSFRLLKILTVLSPGEVFGTLRRFDPTEPLYPENIQELQGRGLLEAVPFSIAAPELRSSSPAVRLDASAPKLLVVPRQVRDYVHSIMPEEETREIVRRAFELYFGPRWREGEASLPPTTKLRIREGSIGGSGNPHIVAVRLLRDSLEHGDTVTFAKTVRLAEAYLQALEGADRYRDAYSAAQDILHLVEAAGLRVETARVAALAGRALRMTGPRDDAIRLLEKALEYANPEIGKAWQAGVYLNLALAHQSVGDKAAAVAAAKQVEKLADPKSSHAYHARAVILECEAGNDWEASGAFEKLAELEQEARNRGHYVVANNVALEFADRAKSSRAKSEARERVLGTKEDVYNGIRAVVGKANDLLDEGRHAQLTAAERRFLSEAYSYLYSQRFVSLFDRCHRVLWRILKEERKELLLLRLFRFSSFIWRIYGKTKRESDYLQELQTEYPPSKITSPAILEGDEFRYYLARVRAGETSP